MLVPFMERGCSPEGPEDKVYSLDLGSKQFGCRWASDSCCSVHTQDITIYVNISTRKEEQT